MSAFGSTVRDDSLCGQMFGAKLELSITDLHFSGVGTGFNPGYGRIYVPFAFPGEIIEIKLRDKIKEGHWNAERVSAPSGHCSVAGRCGGCIWPAAPYEAQLLWKKKLLLRELKQLPGISEVPVTIHGSAHSTGTRSRIHLHAGFFNGRLDFGFYSRGSRTVIPIFDCPVAEEPIREVVRGLDALRWILFSEDADFGFGIELIHLPEEKDRVLMLLYSAPERRALLRTILSTFADVSPRLIVRIAFEPDSPFYIWERYRGMILYTKPGCFQQVNRQQSLLIRQLIGQKIADEKPRVLFDLYSGSGNYSLPFFADVPRIFGCDENAVGIEVAAINIERNSIDNASYACGDAGDVLHDRVSKGWPEHADFVIADPARQGMSDAVLGHLPGLKCGTLVYIAHHQATFVRDAKFLLASAFSLEQLHLVDFFPFTPQLNIVSMWRSVC